MNTTQSQSYLDTVDHNKKRVISLIKYTLIPIAIIFVLLAVALLVELIGVPKTVTLEAGEELPSAVKVSGKKDARYLDEENIDVSEVGEYDVVVEYGKKNSMKIRFKVEDTTAPIGTVKALSAHHAASRLPSAEDFFSEISDASDYVAKFKEAPSISGVGDYPIEIILEDAYGNKSAHKATLSVINDTEPPVIYPAEVEGYVGEGIAYSSAVTVEDNCFGVELTVDDSKVNLEAAGHYIVTYVATDAAGNRVEAMVPVVIYEKDQLSSLIASIAAEQKMTKDLSKEELCKLIYKYINDPKATADTARFKYVGHSNDKTRSNWRNEAQLTIKNGQGDCYSYFALAKAFFEYFEIENLDIERSKGLTSDTHFWNMVNIGSAADPSWYFFDATRYAGKFTVGGDNGCLLTKAQLDAYKASNSRYDGVYYAFDQSKYPKPQTAIINKDYNFK